MTDNEEAFHPGLDYFRRSTENYTHLLFIFQVLTWFRHLYCTSSLASPCKVKKIEQVVFLQIHFNELGVFSISMLFIIYFYKSIEN